MLPLRYTGRWRVAGAFMLLGVLGATLAPSVLMNMRLPELGGNDKWAHGIAFLILAVWFSGQYSRRSYWKIAISLVAFGALIEVCQYMTRYRTAEWLDLAADCAGIVAGLVVAWAGAGGWSLHLENRLRARKRAV